MAGAGGGTGGWLSTLDNRPCPRKHPPKRQTRLLELRRAAPRPILAIRTNRPACEAGDGGERGLSARKRQAQLEQYFKGVGRVHVSTRAPLHAVRGSARAGISPGACQSSPQDASGGAEAQASPAGRTRIRRLPTEYADLARDLCGWSLAAHVVS